MDWLLYDIGLRCESVNEVKKFKKWFCELFLEDFHIVTLLSLNVFLNCIEPVFQLE